MTSNNTVEDKNTVVADEKPGVVPYPNSKTAWTVVGILLVCYIFSYLDRGVLSLLVEPIKRDFGLSDTQLSLLMGPAFALVYATLGVPMGRLADSKSRKVIIASGLVFWSFMTAGCGIAKNFFQLFLFRMGVGVGEASLMPSAYSIVTDYFPPRKLALAISVLTLGGSIGAGLSQVLGGHIVQFFADMPDTVVPIIGTVRNWQWVFIIVGAPGILFAFVVLLIREPVRRSMQAKTNSASQVESVIPFKDVLAYMRQNRGTFICHFFGFAIYGFVATGIGFWLPSFFERTYGLPAAEAGIRLGYVTIFLNGGGLLVGAALENWLAKRGYRDSKMRVGVIAAILHLPLAIAFPLMPTAEWALLLYCPAILFNSMPFGCAPAAIQEMVPNRMRGQASAVYLLLLSLIAVGLGPIAVAALTDYVFQDPLKLQYSIVIVGFTANLIGLALLWFGLSHFRKTLDNLQKWQISN